jgi:hypothetical protein
MWTIELITRLKQYVDAGRYFKVYYQSHEVFGMDLVPPEHQAEFPADQASIYLEPYDDAPPDNFVSLFDTDLTDFSVYMNMPVANWTEQDPDWSAADPEAWKEAHP